MDGTKFIANFQFMGSSVKKLTVNNNLISISDLDDLKREILTLDYNIDEIFNNENHLYGAITLSVKIKVSKGKNALTISLSIQGGFIAPADTDKDAFAKMLSVNGCATLYSVARSIIISVSAQSLTKGSVVLPMINTFKMKEEKEKEKAKE